MTIHIEIDDQTSPAELRAISAAVRTLLGDDFALEKTPAQDAVKPAPVEEKAKPAATRRAPAAKPAPAPEPEPEESDDDLIGGGDDESDGPTLEDAVARATELVSDGKAQAVKDALAPLKVKRVSELSGDQIAKFLKALA